MWAELECWVTQVDLCNDHQIVVCVVCINHLCTIVYITLVNNREKMLQKPVVCGERQVIQTQYRLGMNETKILLGKFVKCLIIINLPA